MFRNEEDEEVYDGNDGNDEYSEAENGKVKLGDFGLAHVVGKGQDKAHMVYRAGSMEYKAPEVKDVSYLSYLNDLFFIFNLLT